MFSAETFFRRFVKCNPSVGLPLFARRLRRPRRPRFAVHIFFIRQLIRVRSGLGREKCGSGPEGLDFLYFILPLRPQGVNDTNDTLPDITPNTYFMCIYVYIFFLGENVFCF